MVQYSTLKKRIKKRLSVEKQQCIFETGTFKRTVRDDMIKINAFWSQKERELVAKGRACSSTLDEQQHQLEIRRMLRWLTLNYLAVLKIAKKHDKRCQTTLASAISKVLMSQPFVIGLRTSELFASEVLKGGNQAWSSPTLSHLPAVLDMAEKTMTNPEVEATADTSDDNAEGLEEGADSAPLHCDGCGRYWGGAGPTSCQYCGWHLGQPTSLSKQIEQLLGPGSAHYLPNRLIKSIAECELRYDPDLMLHPKADSQACIARMRANGSVFRCVWPFQCWCCVANM